MQRTVQNFRYAKELRGKDIINFYGLLKAKIRQNKPDLLQYEF